jgi:hypothetical protein
VTFGCVIEEVARETRRSEFLRDGRQRKLRQKLTCWAGTFADGDIFEGVFVEGLKGAADHLLLEGDLREREKEALEPENDDSCQVASVDVPREFRIYLQQIIVEKMIALPIPSESEWMKD